MLKYYVISHKTQENDIIYYDEEHNIFVTTIENATWYEDKVQALLVCRHYLRAYTNITILTIE